MTELEKKLMSMTPDERKKAVEYISEQMGMPPVPNIAKAEKHGFKIGDRVIIIKKDITGIVVDISLVDNKKIYIIESDSPNNEDGYGGTWKLFDCTEDDIIPQNRDDNIDSV